MSTTAHERWSTLQTPTPDRPARDCLARMVDPSELADLNIESIATKAPARIEIHLASVPARPSFGPYILDIDDGLFVLTDILGAVYGTGSSVDEARADFLVALDDHLRYLRQHDAELDDRLRVQRAALERLFPGR